MYIRVRGCEHCTCACPDNYFHTLMKSLVMIELSAGLMSPSDRPGLPH